jgi:hypothetical protein
MRNKNYKHDCHQYHYFLEEKKNTNKLTFGGVHQRQGAGSGPKVLKCQAKSLESPRSTNNTNYFNILLHFAIKHELIIRIALFIYQLIALNP